MKKILTINGIKTLSKKEQQYVKGGMDEAGCKSHGGNWDCNYDIMWGQQVLVCLCKCMNT